MARRRTRTSPNQSRASSRFGSPGVLIATAVLAVLSLWLLVGLVDQVITGTRQDRLIAVREQELATIVAQNDALGTAVAYATSPAYAEQVAREQLGYAREGDTVILPSFSQATPTVVQPTPAALPTPVAQANWRGWVGAFFPPEPTPTPVP